MKNVPLVSDTSNCHESALDERNCPTLTVCDIGISSIWLIPPPVKNTPESDLACAPGASSDVYTPIFSRLFSSGLYNLA